MPGVSVDRELGDLNARMSRVEQDLLKQGNDLAEVLKILTQAQGGWKVLVVVGGVAAVIGGIVTRVLQAVWPG